MTLRMRDEQVRTVGFCVRCDESSTLPVTPQFHRSPHLWVCLAVSQPKLQNSLAPFLQPFWPMGPRVSSSREPSCTPTSFCSYFPTGLILNFQFASQTSRTHTWCRPTPRVIAVLFTPGNLVSQVLSLSSQFALLQAKLQEEARERERSLTADMNTYRITPLSSGTITPMLPLPPMDIFTLHEAYTLAQQQQQQLLQPRYTGSSNNSQGDLRLNSISSMQSVQMGPTSRRSSVMDSGMIGGGGTGLPMMSLAEVVSHMGTLSSKILGIQSQSWRLISR